MYSKKFRTAAVDVVKKKGGGYRYLFIYMKCMGAFMFVHKHEYSQRHITLFVKCIFMSLLSVFLSEYGTYPL